MMELVVWDVQHGSSTYLKTPLGKHIVIDLGTGDYSENNATFSPLLHLKGKYKIQQLDQVIISHPHTDHIDDIMNFELLNPRTLLRPKHLSKEDIIKANPGKDKKKIDKYIEISNRYSCAVKNEDNPKNPVNNGGVDIKTFTPSKCGTSNINNHSVVTIIEYLGVKVFIPGDNEPESWKELLGNSEFIKAIKDTNIFVASHHGRESGYCANLFDHFSPYLVIISDGPYVETSATDRYSKIAKGWEVYSRSEGAKIPYERKCLTTRKDGTIVIKVWKSSESIIMNVTTE